MKTSRILAFVLVLAGGLAIPAGAARAQAQAAAAAAAASVVAKTITRAYHAITSKPSGDWLTADVIHFDSHSMIVREADNERMIHTFTYASTLQPKVQTLVDKGGYQYGDQVKILIQPGQNVALEIHGKPSKPQ
ncbi:MAG TPA: hypothetical protein VNK23_03385 [Candidatus Dormibacteraeota bacterium]|nr:hypothetical protein [Candidatus Dormibacteraeota bacterium]